MQSYDHQIITQVRITSIAISVQGLIEIGCYRLSDAYRDKLFFIVFKIHERDKGEEMQELQTVWAQGQEQSRQVLSAMFQKERCCKSSLGKREFASEGNHGQRW